MNDLIEESQSENTVHLRRLGAALITVGLLMPLGAVVVGRLPISELGIETLQNGIRANWSDVIFLARNANIRRL